MSSIFSGQSFMELFKNQARCTELLRHEMVSLSMLKDKLDHIIITLIESKGDCSNLPSNNNGATNISTPSNVTHNSTNANPHIPDAYLVYKNLLDNCKTMKQLIIQWYHVGGLPSRD